MPDVTPKRGLPYPEITDPGPPDVAGDFQQLAEAVDTQLGSRGKSIVATAQTRTNAAFATLTTPDQVANLVLPTDGILKVRFRALWKVNGGGTAEATIFVGANQLKTLAVDGAPALVSQALGTAADQYSPLYTHNLYGLATDESSTADTTLVTTGFIMSGGVGQGDHDLTIEGLPAATYTVSVQFRSNGVGTVSVKDRKLHAWVLPF